MSAIPLIRPPSRPIVPVTSNEPLYPLSVEQYHAMIASGVLVDDDPVELIEGLLVTRMPKNPLHAKSLGKLHAAIFGKVPAGWVVRNQEPVTLDDGEPEPDLVVARGSHDDYAARHPGPADVVVVIEIADTTLARDRGIKLRSYARAGIPTYWIVNVVDRQVEVHTRPDPAATPEPTYRDRQVVSVDGVVTLSCGGVSVALPVADVL